MKRVFMALILLGVSFVPKAQCSEIPFTHSLELVGFSSAGCYYGADILNALARLGGEEKCPHVKVISITVCTALDCMYRASEWSDAPNKHIILRKLAWDLTGVALYGITHIQF